MEDLNGLQWTSNGDAAKKAPALSPAMYSSMRTTSPVSGRSTPLTNVTSNPTSNPTSKPSTPANDSFANLVSFNSTTSHKNLSLQDQQKRLAEQKAQQNAAQAKQLNASFGSAPEQFWDNLGSGRSTSAQPFGQPPKGHRTNDFTQNYTPSSSNVNAAEPTGDEDILAAFNAAAPVDSSSHFPKPTATPPVINQSGGFSGGMNAQPAVNTDLSNFDNDDDDPFGLSQMSQKQQRQPVQEAESIDDDDVLGLLGKPVTERPKPQPKVETPNPIPENTSTHPQEKAISELVDMGFPSDKAREALEATESGLDVQAAVGWLLHQAHEETRQKSKSKAPQDRSESQSMRREHSSRSTPEEQGPAWLRSNSRTGSASRKRDNQTPEKDPAQMASEFGNALFKTAGSLWKQGTKRMQQAVQELNQAESDSSTPKWMRDGSADARDRRPNDRPTRERQSESSVTDEAMMLESDRTKPAPRQPPRPRDALRQQSGLDSSRDPSPAIPSKLRQQESQPAFLRQQQSASPSHAPPKNGIKSSLSKQAIEEQAASAYTSSARRRKAPAQISTTPEPDLLDATSSLAATRPATTTPVPSTSRAQSATTPLPSRSRSTVPKRIIPNVPSGVMVASNNHRETGTAQFKRGDYSAAHTSYTSALTQIPTTHPITIVILTNRALTALKIGEPRTALSDADNALSVIGASKGEAETITISASEPPKQMREYYGKALMRKAEALEQMEKWSEAASVWREAVDGNHGGAISRAGKTRCEKAAGITKPQPRASVNTPSRPSATKKAASAPPKPAGSGQASAAAVSKLREANAAAEKIDDEKFALADKVDATITTWKGGKADNLRALLGSLDTVLWPEAGWKKVGMSELVLPNKVKIQYMKGISKVHPDKIATTATTEQRMIAGAVFSTLNEAWDKFKKENNL